MSLNLFPDQKVNTNIKSIGNGFALEILKENLIIIYYKGEVLETYEFKNGIDKRILVVDLVDKRKVTKYLLSTALGISRQSIDDWLSLYERSGYEGLINSYKGGTKEGRQAASAKLPVGNKSERLVRERQKDKEAIAEQMPELDFPQNGEQVAGAFDEEYEEQENRYGGSFVYWAIFEGHFGLSDFLGPRLGAYSLVIWLFLMMQVNRIGSLEQLKTAYKTAFGRILGIHALPSRPVISRLIKDLLAKKDTTALKEAFSQYQVKQSLVSLYQLFLDGHFLPYTGKERVHKGFHTQSRQMKQGQTELYVHDAQQRVVWFDIQEGKPDMVSAIIEYTRRWRTYMGDIAPLWVVDRELWGVKNFLALSACRFVTWEKHSNKEALKKMKEEDFGQRFEFNGKSYRVWEGKKRYSNREGDSIELRRIVLWNLRTGKRVVMVAQDELEDSQTIAEALLNRWGKSENSFKHMGSRMNMHYNPAMDLSQESEKQDVENPTYRILKKKISQVKAAMTKLDSHLGKGLDKNKGQKQVKIGKRIETLLAEKEQLRQELTQLQQALEQCPQRIDISSVKPGAAFQKIKSDAKNLWDMAGSIFWNSRKKLAEELAQFLANPRDLLPVLDAITTGRAWVRSTSKGIFIKLEALEIPRFKAAQVQLCNALNQKNVTLCNGKLLRFSVKTD